MSSILFLALQCCECSTMQVKQKKKSSNNWICVVCNQKQSVLRVFAQAYKAKDLRLFVQSFNMSRKVADEEKQAAADTAPEVEDDTEVSDVRGKRRSDWSEYLDSDPINERRRLTVEEEEEDVKIVTEIPKEVFKRPKLKRYSNAGGGPSSASKGGVKRDDNKQGFPSDIVMKRKNDTERGKLETARVTKPGSKWDAYLINDEGGHQGLAARFSGREAVGEWDKPVMDVSSEYQIVDDEVHPDFM